VRQSFLDLEAILLGEDSQEMELFLASSSQLNDRDVASMLPNESSGKIANLFLECLKVDSQHQELCHFVFTQLCMFVNSMIIISD
jgi:hypothetical protein